MADTTAAAADPLAQLTAIKALEFARRAQLKTAAVLQRATAALKGANQAHKDAGDGVAAAFGQLAAAGLTAAMLRDLGIAVPAVPTKTLTAAPPIGVAAADHSDRERKEM